MCAGGTGAWRKSSQRRETSTAAILGATWTMVQYDRELHLEEDGPFLGSITATTSPVFGSILLTGEAPPNDPNSSLSRAC
jgi:hypothetical protein